MASLVSLTNAVAVAIALLVLHRIGLIIYRFVLHPLSKFPGPKYLAISGLIRFYYENVRGEFYKEIRDLHDQYGNIVRIAPNELSIDGSIGWEDIYGHKKAGKLEFLKDPLFYQGVGVPGAQHILGADKETHRRQRQLMGHAFSDSALNGQEGIIKSYIDLLILRLGENAARGNVVDLVKWYNYTTFDIIGDLAFGDPFQCLETSNMHPWVTSIFSNIKLMSILRIFVQYPLMKAVLPLLFSTKSAQEKLNQHGALVTAKLDKRLALGVSSPRKDFLSYILEHNDENGMSYQELWGNSDVLIVAGSETTATSLSGLTYYLSQNQEVWRRLKIEVRESFRSEDEMTMRSTAPLPYLSACLEEGLRIYPPVDLTPPRDSPGATINGEYIPKGTRVWIHQWSTHHRGSNFLLPENFIPERWLPSSHKYYDPRFDSDNRACVKPFAYGPRNCIGMNLAYAEMRLIIARLAWNFDLECMPECKEWTEGQKSYIIMEKPPLLMRLHSAKESQGSM